MNESMNEPRSVLAQRSRVSFLEAPRQIPGRGEKAIQASDESSVSGRPSPREETPPQETTH